MTELFDVTKLIEKYRKLEQENERLKEEISIARENYGLEMEFQMMYREALEEIREIAEKRNYLNLDEALDDILDKINEVLK